MLTLDFKKLSEKLPDDGYYNTHCLNEQSLNVLHEIWNDLSVLEPEDNDWSLSYTIYIALDNVFDCDEPCKGKLQVVKTDNDITISFITGDVRQAVGNFSTVQGDENKYDYVDELNYVKHELAKVINNIDEYNKELENELPYFYRTGKILHKKINEICGYHIYDMPDDLIDKIKLNTPHKYDKLTLRIYGEIWGEAHNVIYGLNSYPLETFINRHAMDNIDQYDLDSEDDFMKWTKQVQHYHGFDIEYARITLYPQRTDDNKYILDLTCAGEWWLRSFLKIYDILYNDVRIEKEMYRDICSYDDIITFEENSSKYFSYDIRNKEYITTSLFLYDPEYDDILVNNIEWDDIEQYKLKKKL